MTTINAKRCSVSTYKGVAALALLAVISGVTASHAGSSRTDIEQREQALRNAAAAADQRSQQAKETADRQRRLIIDQVRRNKQLQCKAAGGGPAC